MKKLIIGLLLLLCLPGMVQAKEEKVQVYLFKGEGCPHCEEALEFFNGLSKEEKELFELNEYEVWNDTRNKTLMTKVASKLGEQTKGVPYIVIGEKSFNGFTKEIGEQILTTIHEMNEEKNFEDIVSPFTKKGMSDSIAVGAFVVSIAAIIIFIIIARNKM